MTGTRGKSKIPEKILMLKYDGQGLRPVEHDPVKEIPVTLRVNDIELATLIGSPHDLQFLVAGFLRLQGLIVNLEDIQMLSVCSDMTVATVRIKGDIPHRLTPTFTSGCGRGITFNNSDPVRQGTLRGDRPAKFIPEHIITMMAESAKMAELYKHHGGIHSAAVGDGTSLFLYAEDIGRHNTLDRIAGEALLKGIDLSGKILVTSGRVSSEMAAKAALLGVSLIASRTSPTDMAVQICDELGITLVGYVRGGKFNLYSHPERVKIPSRRKQIEGITGVILAGGASRRMGSNKALLPYRGGRFIESIYRQMTDLFREVLIVTNTPDLYDFLPCRKVADLFPGMGALAGIHSALYHSDTHHVFMTACDMPSICEDLVRYLASLIEEHDVVIPESDLGLEPLHAIYSKGSFAAIDEALKMGKRRLVSFFGAVAVKRVTKEEVSLFDPHYASFQNINTPEDYFTLREGTHKRSDGNPSREQREDQEPYEPPRLEEEGRKGEG